MEAKELRINNLVQDSSGLIIEVESISEVNEAINLPDNEWESGTPLNRIFGIELTEEWLLKMGFSKHSTNPFWFRKKQICISLVGAIELISWDMQIFKIDTKVDHVHQLQNLYFALTSEELSAE